MIAAAMGLGLLWQILTVLIVIGVVVWLVESAPFISASIKPFIRWAAIAVGVIFLLKLLITLLGGM